MDMTTFTRKMYTNSRETRMRGEKSDAGEPDEKQFYLCGLIFKIEEKSGWRCFHICHAYKGSVS
jgi:hypothetical protein